MSEHFPFGFMQFNHVCVDHYGKVKIFWVYQNHNPIPLDVETEHPVVSSKVSFMPTGQKLDIFVWYIIWVYFYLFRWRYRNVMSPEPTTFGIKFTKDCWFCNHKINRNLNCCFLIIAVTWGREAVLIKGNSKFKKGIKGCVEIKYYHVSACHRIDRFVRVSKRLLNKSSWNGVPLVVMQHDNKIVTQIRS